MSLARPGVTEGSGGGTADAAAGRDAWLAREVPNILVGLEASRGISERTAAAAWRLCDHGDHGTALSLVLSEALADPQPR